MFGEEFKKIFSVEGQGLPVPTHTGKVTRTLPTRVVPIRGRVIANSHRPTRPNSTVVYLLKRFRLVPVVGRRWDEVAVRQLPRPLW